ncbi:MAG: helix-turn-helix transcriptional regulator [Bdellovibrionota bacterium]|nr:helix-turn-helix transcriptional regulator [Bdellovibrionota bacterium]
MKVEDDENFEEEFEFTNEGEISLGKVIVKELNRRNISASSLAKECGVPVTTLHNWIQGIKPSTSSMKYVKSLANYFNMSLDELFFGITKKDKSEVIYRGTYSDQGTVYRVTIEKLGPEN